MPGLRKTRDVDAQRGLLAAETRWAAHRPGGSEDPMRRLALAERSNWFWACDRCLGSASAEAADPSAVNIGMGTPFAAYVDRAFVCTEDDGQ